MPLSFLDIARSLLRLPTAPFHEHHILDYVGSFAAARPGIQLRRDRYGNILLFTGSSSSQTPPLVLTAHLDHPGMVWRENLAPDRARFEILGGTNLQQVLASGVRLFDIDQPPNRRGRQGRIVGTAPAPSGRYPLIEVATAKPDQWGPGTFAMWDLPACRLRGRTISGRALDDLAGVAVGLAVLEALGENPAPGSVGLLLTRAEEVGFVGMLAAIEMGFLRKKALYINIECSSVKAGAQQGAGPILRIGDRLWVFDPAVSGGLVAVAEQMRETTPDFRWQRKLMDSGACEATALMQAGFRSGAVALPLGNYHNIGPGAQLAPETINLDDALMLVELLVQLAHHGTADSLARSSSALDAMLASRLDKYRDMLAPTLREK